MRRQGCIQSEDTLMSKNTKLLLRHAYSCNTAFCRFFCAHQRQPGDRRAHGRRRPTVGKRKASVRRIPRSRPIAVATRSTVSCRQQELRPKLPDSRKAPHRRDTLPVRTTRFLAGAPPALYSFDAAMVRRPTSVFWWRLCLSNNLVSFCAPSTRSPLPCRPSTSATWRWPRQ